MKKLQTSFRNFQISGTKYINSISVVWYKLKIIDGSEFEGECFTQDEFDVLLKYVINNKANFENSDYRECDSEEEAVPMGSIYDEPLSQLLPYNFLLRKEPLDQPGGIYPCMDILLLDESGQLINHTYKLDFDLIGKIGS